MSYWRGIYYVWSIQQVCASGILAPFGPHIKTESGHDALILFLREYSDIGLTIRGDFFMIDS